MLSRSVRKIKTKHYPPFNCTGHNSRAYPTPFGAFTFFTLIFLPPLVVVALAFPVSSLLFRDWLGKYPEFQTALTVVNILMFLGVITVDVAIFFEGKIVPDISLH
jgi:hypothetical protein